MQYYCDPGTGQRFHSLICIQKRLSGETSRSAKPGNKKYASSYISLFYCGGLPVTQDLSRSLFDLPNGWVVERKPCKNIDYAVIIDKHYHELETGKLFRSLRSVERDLTEGKKHIVTLEALEAEDHFIPFESSGSRKEHVSSKKVETAMLDPSSIPAKIKWVLGGPGGIVWNPFMDDHLVPGFIKQKCINTMAFDLNGHRLIEDVLTDSWQHASGGAWKSRA
ncbi:METHYL-CPG-BINDING DOMAIN-CONTAINING PROTEIN 7 [Salix purpurea]|uniref:METHYL-CPG-BINDING DOMAIN-CONTAINING PROTEIN 7 n=1 Tax=Salix purpurea TaxID=77065 RepID=A0A9Q0SVY3_SALPP|nr:METHYL-CPG-BINDING DOMAIN-CONTAINING PROTEIN 7 [Salix purpurea]